MTRQANRWRIAIPGTLLLFFCAASAPAHADEESRDDVGARSCHRDGDGDGDDEGHVNRCPSNGRPPIEIVGCEFDITMPGNYALKNDLHCAGGGILVHEASNVCIELRGHHIHGSPTGTGVAVVMSGRVTVIGAGAKISGFAAGVRLADTSYVTIRDLTVSHGRVGAHMELTDYARFERVTATENSDAGFELLGDLGANRIERCRANRNGTDGIRLTAGPEEGSTVVDSETDENCRYGIFVASGATGNEISHNRSRNNGDFDMFDGNLPDACVNTWSHNYFLTDNESGGDFGPHAGCIQ